MSSLNKVQLIGNLGADPEIRHTQDGRKVANLRLATTESWKDRNTGEKRERTEWHKVSIFSEGLANIAETYLKKGSSIYIEGKLQTEKYTDQQGIERYQTKIVLMGFNAVLKMLNGSQSQPQNNNYQQQHHNQAHLETAADQHIPY